MCGASVLTLCLALLYKWFLKFLTVIEHSDILNQKTCPSNLATGYAYLIYDMSHFLGHPSESLARSSQIIDLPVFFKFWRSRIPKYHSFQGCAFQNYRPCVNGASRKEINILMRPTTRTLLARLPESDSPSRNAVLRVYVRYEFSLHARQWSRNQILRRVFD